MSTKEYRSWPYAQMQTAEQQIMEFLCVAVYEAHHYHDFKVYIRATSPHHVQYSKPFVVLLL